MGGGGIGAKGRLKIRRHSVRAYAHTYDPVGRLLTVTKDATLVEEYRYEPLTGIRSYEMNALRGISGRSYTYSAEDHLLTAGATTYQYSPDGFLTNRTNGSNQTSYLYSSRGELLSVTLPGRLIEYVHDPLGRRIAKKIDGTITEKYLWQGLTRLLAVYDGSNTLLMRFEYADGRMPVAMNKGSAIYHLAYDQVGSLRVVADAGGSVVKRIDYDSFGNIIGDTNPTFTVPFGFAGGLHDRDTNLIRFGFRDYDPDVGRWLAKDPIGFRGGDANLYGYVKNDPIRVTDPLGLDYMDLNLSYGFAVPIGGIPVPIGITGGVMLDDSYNIYPYLGGGLVSPGFGASLTWPLGPCETPVPGWTVAGQVAYGGVYQRGYSFGDGGSWFKELGMGTPGAALVGYHVFGPVNLGNIADAISAMPAI